MRPFLLISVVVVAACTPNRPVVGDGGAGGGGFNTNAGGGSGGGAGGGMSSADASTSVCGDGQRTDAESCDDANLMAGDGCSPGCTVESGYFCPFPPIGQSSRCEPACGDGRLVGTEPCDDANARNGDGCSNTCVVEPGYSCSGMPSVCRVTCGDGVRGGSELCDDANLSNADGCSSTCQVEAGYVCLGTPSVCRPICGDGVLTTSEVCDDGFTDACGSCNAQCSGVGSGSSCGDGMRCAQTEACDDGNTTPNDGCSATCTVENAVDAGTSVDAGMVVPDAGVLDAGVIDAGSVMPDAGQPGSGAFAYQRIANISFIDDFTRVTWHPSGRFALLLGASGRVIKYDPTAKSLALVQQVGTTVTDLDVTSDGSFFVIAGVQSGVSHLWRMDVGASDVLATAVDLGALTGTVSAVAVQPGTSRFAAITRSATFGLNYLYLWTSAGLSTAKGYNAGGNALSLMWGAPSLYAGSANILTADGVNGADSKTWVEQSNLFVANTWSPGFGNPGAGSWQPGGAFGAFVGWSSNKLYVFDGSWHLVNLPGNTGISPQSFAFRADGQRGLIVGRPVGIPLAGTVIEYRPTAPGAFDDASFVDVSIAGFANQPYAGSSNQYLLDVAWRPGTCDEGLIVGMDNGSSQSPTFGLAIRFYDSAQAACSP